MHLKLMWKSYRLVSGRLSVRTRPDAQYVESIIKQNSSIRLSTQFYKVWVRIHLPL